MFAFNNGNNAAFQQTKIIPSDEPPLQGLLEDVAGRITKELETLGYEVAREEDPRIACSIFILATDIEKRLRSLAERSSVTEAA